jgi:hypothetical protein
VIVRDRHRRASIDQEHRSAEAELVEFETGPVAGRRRGVDPVVLAAAVVTVLLVAAVVKPWGGTASPAEQAAAAEAAARLATGRPAASGQVGMRQPAYVLPVPASVERTPLPPRGLVLEALSARDEWGARALFELPERLPKPGGVADRRVEERWLPAAPPLPGGIRSLGPDSSDAVVFQTGGRVTRMIGITTPADVTVRHVQVQVVRPLGRRTRVQVVAVPDGHRGTFLFAPTTLDGRINPWPGGTYQISLEVDGVATAVTIVLDPGDRPA